MGHYATGGETPQNILQKPQVYPFVTFAFFCAVEPLRAVPGRPQNTLQKPQLGACGWLTHARCCGLSGCDTHRWADMFFAAGGPELPRVPRQGGLLI